jgi:molecular chaperone DnaK
MQSEETAFGIDLGTTNSCISYLRAGIATVIEIKGRKTTPSVVGFRDDEWIFGFDALNYSKIRPEDTIRSFKRHMGNKDKTFFVGSKALTAEDLSGKLLAYIKSEAEKEIGLAVRDVVITVPAWFNDSERKSTITAGQKAGLNILRIINEPTAAAIAFDHGTISKASEIDAEEIWLTYDLGGGTFDVSVLSVKGDYKEVKASTGNTFLGGDDFDNLLVNWIIREIKDEHNLDISQDSAAVARLQHIAENAKITLSQDTEVTINEVIKLGGTSVLFERTLARETFESLIEELIASTMIKTKQAIEDSGIVASDITRLLLVGGSTRIPLIRAKLESAYGLIPDLRIDPDLSVSLGACEQAGTVAGITLNCIVVDVAAHSLGVAVMSDIDMALLQIDPSVDMDTYHPHTFVSIIDKNSRLPAKFSKKFMTGHDGQDGIKVVVYQGEASTTRLNDFVGEFIVDIEPCPAGTPVHVCFEYDFNSIVKISIALDERDKLIKVYSMDTTRSANLNSDVSRGVAISAGSDDDLIPNSAGRTNFLIERVKKLIGAHAIGENNPIHLMMTEYGRHFSAQNDGELDALEDRIYGWMDSIETEIHP